jgi:tRNA (guanine37-N1)-methyltransferase
MSDFDSARGDSFFGGGLSAPSYTRPPEYRGHSVPEVLLSGDHKKIADWRRAEGERLTREAAARATAARPGAPAGAPPSGAAEK